jgi:hypothetical protein
MHAVCFAGDLVSASFSGPAYGTEEYEGANSEVPVFCKTNTGSNPSVAWLSGAKVGSVITSPPSNELFVLRNEAGESVE